MSTDVPSAARDLSSPLFLSRIRAQATALGQRGALALLGLGLGLPAMTALLAAGHPYWALSAAMLTGASLPGLWAAFARLRSPATAATAPAVECPPLGHMRRLDEEMLRQLARAIDLSETSALQLIERVTGLRGASSRLMAYLHSAQSHSTQMQSEIERSGSIVGELAHFVQQLPQQIADERQHIGHLVQEVRQLSGITETIRGMARQTEILAMNAAVAAARAGEAGRGFAVLAGEVRRLALQSNEAAREIEQHIGRLVETVQARSSGDAAARLQHNETEASRLLTLTRRLDEGYLDMRQFYGMLLTAITEHNTALNSGITELLDTAQYQDIFRQIVDRLAPTMRERQDVLNDLVERLRQGEPGVLDTHEGAQALVERYVASEARHRDPDATCDAQPGEPARRIELF
ncbi:methyl-accepting chemotaxis protein [Pseudaquabacterium rugosum]|uniref:Methyl-accepting chemotaxis protein n=1 Tax=Pseudaquabacterium rugosum TaxID=2984194 RepID=A0ABU9B935_9BURK